MRLFIKNTCLDLYIINSQISPFTEAFRKTNFAFFSCIFKLIYAQLLPQSFVVFFSLEPVPTANKATNSEHK